MIKEIRTFVVSPSSGKVFKKVDLSENRDGFVEHIIELPLEVTKGKQKIRPIFKADDKNRVSHIYDCRLLKN